MKAKTISKLLVRLSSVICTIGAAVFSAGAAREHLSKIIQIPDAAYNTLLVTGSVLISLSILGFIVSLLGLPSKLILENVVYRNLGSKYICVYAKQSDVSRLHSLYTEYFGGDVPSPDLMRAWIRQLPKAFSMIYRIDDESIKKKQQVLVGSFKVLMLTEDAVCALEAEQLSGSTFQPEHLARRQTDAAASYVGDVIGTTRFAQGVLLGYLNAACEQAIKRGLPIYARPLTKEGKRVMRKYGFVEVSDNQSPPEIGRICKLVIEKHDVFTVTRKSRQRRRKSPEQDA
jgi:hypothetical protein